VVCKCFNFKQEQRIFYLGKCIITFWKFQSNWMSGMNCPVCRQSVCIFLEAHEQSENNENDIRL
jgi:hypothetical protein